MGWPGGIQPRGVKRKSRWLTRKYNTCFSNSVKISEVLRLGLLREEPNSAEMTPIGTGIDNGGGVGLWSPYLDGHIQ